MTTEIDLKGQKCHDCSLGTLEESSIQDDLEGTDLLRDILTPQYFMKTEI